MRILRRIPAVEYLVFLRVVEAGLPCPASKKVAEDDGKCPVVLEVDREGALEGHALFFTRGKLLSKANKERLKSLYRLARTASAPSTNPVTREEIYQRAVDLGESIWSDLKDDSLAGRPSPAFARVNVILLRSGECRLTVHEVNLFTSKEVKAAQAQAGGDASKLTFSSPAFGMAAASAARQTFFFMRDLAHRHYHHRASSDLLTTTYGWDADNDQTWRRETQYGLARMAIAARRRDTAESYKQALGLVAYAEAFQKHLCGWFTDRGGNMRRSVWGFAYDFAALRQSIDASLKVRELKDSQRRQTWLFVFGFTVTMLGLAVTGIRNATAIEPGSEAARFKAAIEFATHHPIVALVAAGVAAWMFDFLVNRFSTRTQIVEPAMGGLARFSEALMGSLMRRFRTPLVSKAAALLVLFFLILALGLLSFFAYLYAYRALAAGAAPP